MKKDNNINGFIVSYKIENDDIHIKTNLGNKYKVKYTKDVEKKIIEKMKSQVKNTKINYDYKKTFYKLVTLLNSLVIPLSLTIVINNPQIKYWLLLMTQIACSSYFAGDWIINAKKDKDIKLIKQFLNEKNNKTNSNSKELDNNFKKNHNIKDKNPYAYIYNPNNILNLNNQSNKSNSNIKRKTK